MGSDADTEAVAINKKIVKRKRSRILAPLMLLLMLGAGGGGAYMIYQNWDALASIGGSSKPVPEKAETPAEKLSPVDLDKIPEVDVDEVMANSANVTFRTAEEDALLKKRIEEKNNEDAVAATIGLVEQLPKMDDPFGKGNETKEPNEGDTVTPEGMTPESETAEPVVGTEPGMSETETPDPGAMFTTVSLNESQLARLRRNLQRGHRQIYRRDSAGARKAFALAGDVANEVLTRDEDKFEGEQKGFVQNISDSAEILELVEGFWQQVQASAQQISGAQEIVIGTQIVAFVEARPNSVIIRRSGGNIEYGFGFCPPGLANAIAEQGAVPDVPTWNKQKAAFYAIDQIGGLDHTQRIDEFLKIAEGAGHDCEAIRRFSQFDFGMAGLPEQKVEMPRGNKVDPAIEEFRQEVGYKRIKSLEPADALAHAELLMQIDSPNFPQQVALLEESRQLAIRAGNANVLEDAILELDKYAAIKKADLMCESFSKIASEKITPLQARILMERAIGYLNTSEADAANLKVRKVLVTRLAKLAESFIMPDALRRLQQLEN